MNFVDCNPTFGDILNQRLGRRDAIRNLATASILSVATPVYAQNTKSTTSVKMSRGFQEIERGADETHHVAAGYRADVLIRWGDPITETAPQFDPFKQTASAQEQQFGYNNDYLGFVQLSEASGVLCVNHEYTNSSMMHPGVGRSDGNGYNIPYTKDMADIELAASGLSFVELERNGNKWQLAKPGRFNRRLSMRSGEFEITGPAAGHGRLKTAADPRASLIIGTMNNCGGGMTPWGTYLSGEENIDVYFSGALAADSPEKQNHDTMGVTSRTSSQFHKYDPRFDISMTPNEPNRFGWVVEVDPLDPTWRAKKRTALGRFKHEGAETILNKNGSIVIYMGDDQQFECLYRFVTKQSFNPSNRLANRDLLDEGTLSAARFDADGTLLWLPLIFGQGPLTPANGFQSQADVVIEARKASRLLGATRMDRPEDVEPNPRNGKVYVMLTNNKKRTTETIDAANPRAENVFGHIVELETINGDHAADKMRWSVLVKCGDPAEPVHNAKWHDAISPNGWFAAPDNCAVDPTGRLWVATDQGSNWNATGSADGIWALDTEGATRGLAKMFFRCPIGAEMCGPRFTADGKTLFVAVQHPGTDGMKENDNFGRYPTFEDPGTRWPNPADSKLPPQPAVVVITKDDGGIIGG
jgi:uncharacterized protein